MKQLLLIFLLHFALLNVFAQGKIQRPNNNEVINSLIKDEHYQMKWYALQDTAKTEIAQVYTSVLKENDHILFKTTVKMVNNPDWVDETIVELPNLKPIKHSSTNIQRDMLLSFEKESKVSGYYLDKANNKRTEINEKFDGDFFDSNIYPQLIRWLPLKENYKTEISIFDYNPKTSIGIVKAYVTDTKSGVYKDKTVWIVYVTDDISNKHTISILYIDTHTREILKQEINMGTTKMLMERILA